MNGNKRYAARTKKDAHQSDSDPSLQSGELSDCSDAPSGSSEQSTSKPDRAGEKKVRCRYCLKVEWQLRTIKKHAKRHHKYFYK